MTQLWALSRAYNKAGAITYPTWIPVRVLVLGDAWVYYIPQLKLKRNNRARCDTFLGLARYFGIMAKMTGLQPFGVLALETLDYDRLDTRLLRQTLHHVPGCNDSTPD